MDDDIRKHTNRSIIAIVQSALADCSLIRNEAIGVLGLLMLGGNADCNNVVPQMVSEIITPKSYNLTQLEDKKEYLIGVSQLMEVQPQCLIDAIQNVLFTDAEKCLGRLSLIKTVCYEKLSPDDFNKYKSVIFDYITESMKDESPISSECCLNLSKSIFTEMVNILDISPFSIFELLKIELNSIDTDMDIYIRNMRIELIVFGISYLIENKEVDDILDDILAYLLPKVLDSDETYANMLFPPFKIALNKRVKLRSLIDIYTLNKVFKQYANNNPSVKHLIWNDSTTMLNIGKALANYLNSVHTNIDLRICAAECYLYVITCTEKETLSGILLKTVAPIFRFISDRCASNIRSTLFHALSALLQRTDLDPKCIKIILPQISVTLVRTIQELAKQPSDEHTSSVVEYLLIVLRLFVKLHNHRVETMILSFMGCMATTDTEWGKSFYWQVVTCILKAAPDVETYIDKIWAITKKELHTSSIVSDTSLCIFLDCLLERLDGLDNRDTLIKEIKDCMEERTKA